MHTWDVLLCASCRTALTGAASFGPIVTDVPDSEEDGQKRAFCVSDVRATTHASFLGAREDFRSFGRSDAHVKRA